MDENPDGGWVEKGALGGDGWGEEGWEGVGDFPGGVYGILGSKWPEPSNQNRNLIPLLGLRYLSNGAHCADLT